jgi:hypothetical protein
LKDAHLKARPLERNGDGLGQRCRTLSEVNMSLRVRSGTSTG